jgi:hypothetical protein
MLSPKGFRISSTWLAAAGVALIFLAMGFPAPGAAAGPGGFGTSVPRLDMIRAEAAALMEEAKGASPDKLKALDEQAAKLIEEVRIKYPQMVPKSPQQPGRVVKVGRAPASGLAARRSTAASPFESPQAKRPDLKITSLGIGSKKAGTVAEGSRVKITFTIQNDGTSMAAGTAYKMDVSCKVVSKEGRCPLSASTKVGLSRDLPPGQSVDQSVVGGSMAVPGTYGFEVVPINGKRGVGKYREITVVSKRRAVKTPTRSAEPPPSPGRAPAPQEPTR